MIFSSSTMHNLHRVSAEQLSAALTSWAEQAHACSSHWLFKRHQHCGTVAVSLDRRVSLWNQTGGSPSPFVAAACCSCDVASWIFLSLSFSPATRAARSLSAWFRFATSPLA